MAAATLGALAVVAAPARSWTIRPGMGGVAHALRGDVARLSLAPRRVPFPKCQAVENTPSGLSTTVEKETLNGRSEQPSEKDQQDALATSTPAVRDTFERPLPTDLQFEKPYLARALKAVDNEHPYGTEGYPEDRNLTVLQQHVDFFDSNKDGKIYPWETYTGFRRLGFSHLISGAAGFLINGAFSYPSTPGWLPDPLFAIYTKNIHRTKHGSDTEVYDTEGRFVPTKFEEIFSKYAKTYPDRISLDELNVMTDAQRNVFDTFGRLASRLEWYITYLLVKDEEGFCSKDAIRGVFDGSIFVYIEKKNA